MKVSDAIDARRAVKQFDASHKMSDDDFKSMMDTVLKSPTSFNIQNWRFVRVVDEVKRTKIREAAWNQAQVTDASELFIICGDVKAWDKNPERYWSHAPKETQDILVPMIRPFYEGREWIQRDEVMRSVGIAAQSLMLIAKEMGYDSCPMIGFDQDVVSEIINLPEDHAIGMMLAMGKQANPPHARGAQIDYDEAVITDNF
jgi:nitroreductase